jgi:ribosomal protein S18 acetylase RimI-like enzyme
MNTTVKIIQLPPSRWDEYKALRLTSMQESPQAFGDKLEDWSQYSAEKWQERPNNPNSLIFMAEDNNTYIGMIGVYVKQEEENKKVAHIWGMYVRSEYRGKGIGKQLMEKAIETSQSIPDVEKIQLMVNGEQKAAVQTYTSAGFQIIGTKDWILGDGKRYELLVMEKLFHR